MLMVHFCSFQLVLATMPAFIVFMLWADTYLDAVFASVTPKSSSSYKSKKVHLRDT